jgi:tetratricopeptide (TPR) repeat protein
MKREVRSLNHEKLKILIEQQGLKLYWIADQLNVSRFTVMRWTQGTVRKIKNEHLEKLAKVLGCSSGDLVLEDPLFTTSLAERKYRSIVEIIEKDLAGILIRAGNANLYEVIIKSLEIGTLPLRYQFQLYFSLSSALYNQPKYKEALIFAEKSLEVATRTKNPENLMKASGLIVVSYSALGMHSEAIIAHRRIEEARDLVRPALYYRERTRLLQTFTMMEEPQRAISHFKEMEEEYLKHVVDKSQKAIVFYTIGNCYFKLDRFSEAEHYYRLGVQMAVESQFTVLELECQIGLLRIQTENSSGDRLRNVAEAAAELVEKFKNKTAEKLSYILLMSRVLQKLGSLDQSQELLRRGLIIYKEAPSIVALIHRQMKQT